MNHYHISKNGQPHGIHPESEILAMLSTGEIASTDLCWQEGMEDWRPIHAQMALPATMPPPLPMAAPPLPIYMTQSNQPARMEDNAGMRMLLPVGRSGWAIAAGYLGLISLVVVPAPLALICSIAAIADIRKSKSAVNPKYGMGRAIFGLIMGILGTSILVILLVQMQLKK